MGHERQGAGYDPNAAGYELQGRDRAPTTRPETTGEVLERAAIVLARLNGTAWNADGWSALSDVLQKRYRRQAEAALEAALPAHADLVKALELAAGALATLTKRYADERDVLTMKLHGAELGTHTIGQILDGADAALARSKAQGGE